MRQQLTPQSSEREAYWKPTLRHRPDKSVEAQEPYKPRHIESCPNCGTEYAMGSRFCHLCGASRDPELPSRISLLRRYFDFTIMKDSLGLTTGSLVSFIMGIACLLTALNIGFIYSATTLVDWQAIQVWRIQWLLASTAMFLGGILLKRH